MFLNNLFQDIKILFRDNWLTALVISLSFLFAFATYNGHNHTQKRLNDISEVQREWERKDSVMFANLIKIEKGEKVDEPYWLIPSEPMNIGYRYPRLAIMEPEEFSFISIGQSDMYTHFKSPTVYGNNFALDYSEMVNPVQLLFGNFDLAFVFIYILPLLIIAFTYNILSKEKELGTLRLLSSQPISIISWLFQKILIRFIIFNFITILALITVIFSFYFNQIGLKGTFQVIGLILAYNLFWFVLSYFINITINNSSKNIFSLVGIWLLLVLIVPAGINQISNSIYSPPSRLKMVNDIRSIKKENEKKQNEIMDEYLRNHPEFAEESGQEKFGFWHRYFASEKMMEQKIKPLIAEFDIQLKKQQELIRVFEFISPVTIMQQSMNRIAGTSELHYNDFKKQVFEFSNEWRNYLVPMLFKKEKFTTKNYETLPIFSYQNNIKSKVSRSILIILLINTIIVFVFEFFYHKREE